MTSRSRAVVLTVLLAAGCAPHAASTASTTHPATPPGEPDFTALVERFYGQVEAAHWVPAGAMLSGGARSGISDAQLAERYRDFSDADVNARETSGRTVAVTLTAPARGGRPARVVHERLHFAWNGDAWTIDVLTRR
ncbi:hypothetical protein WPS_28280 [Vulcanimicrobium alpinum]|uniref:DUF3828 domain-containing protein n=1 Tax=Vulcanimicrobium alpinum TaxID=3016050 RepID=A0AAN1Y073_UNVUL|nr:hypothetical protein [Vulcanimicrobium alpinum]BDE07552.1 hypothetical protein WPS_28280 [Vulcanimicrobium alpinum]